DDTLLTLRSQPVPGWRAWPLLFTRVVLLDFAEIPPGRSLKQVDPNGTLVMDLTAFTGSSAEWQPFQTALSNASAVFVQEEQQREMLAALRVSFSQLPAGKMALLPLNTSGAAANFAAFTGLDLKWQVITETQLVGAAYFTANRFPLAFYLGSENYVKTVITNG